MPNQTGDQSRRLIARVLLEASLPQLDHLFDYTVGAELVGQIAVGQRVKVPFRSRKNGIYGYVIELSDDSSFSGDLARVSQIVTPIALLDMGVWSLIRELADRAAGSAGDILRVAIPARQVRAEKTYLAKKADSEDNEDYAPAAITESNERIARELLSRERIFLRVSAPVQRIETGEWVQSWAVAYAEIAVSLLQSDKSSIIIVPDFRDIEQLESVLGSLGVKDFVRLDSRQTNAERYTAHLRALEPRAQIFIGNRSAVYSPAYNLGALLVWDELDESLEEPLTPYVHARDAALLRASLHGSGLLFGAHVISTTLQRLVEMKYFKQLNISTFKPKTIHTGALTRVEAQTGRVPEFASKEIRKALASGPVLVQVARAGFAPLTVCDECGDTAYCTSCNGPIAAKTAHGFECRLCGAPNLNWRCKTCFAERLKSVGAGSVRTAEQFEKMFAGQKVILSDGAHRVLQVDARPAVVVATRGAEPIAYGGYKAVVILDVEKSLGSWSLRSAEDALRRWKGAAMLANPAAKIIIAGGAGPVVQAFVQNTEQEYISSELQDRRLLRFPPAIRVAAVTGPADAVGDAVKQVADIKGVDILGPTAISNGLVRSIVRFEYSNGKEVAKILRAALLQSISSASAKRFVKETGQANSPVRGQNVSKSLRAGNLKLKFDDASVFDDREEQSR